MATTGTRKSTWTNADGMVVGYGNNTTPTEGGVINDSNDYATLSTDNNGNTVLVGADGEEIPLGGTYQLKKGSDGFSVVRGTVGYVKDYDGVWLECLSNEPGYYGGRRVKNLFLNSQNFSTTGTVNYVAGGQLAEATVTYPDTDTTEGLTATNPTGSGYLITSPYGSGGYAIDAGLYAARLTFKVTSGSLSGWTHQQRSGGAELGSESNSYDFTASALDTWETRHATIQHFEKHNGATLFPQCSSNAVASLCYPQIEDVTGHKTGKEINSEFVPSGTSPGIEWFEETFAASTDNAGALYGQDNGVVTYGGKLTVSTSPASIDVKGLYIEPAGTNKVTAWNNLEHVGVAVLDGVSTLAGYESRVPALATNAEVLIDARGGRFVYNKTDITLTDGGAGTDSIDSTSTDFVAAGFRAGQSIWLWRANTPTANGDVQGPFTITSVTANQIVLPTASLTARASGNATHIMRVPKASDKIIVALNNGTDHATTVSSITLPAYNATFQDHGSVIVTVAAAPATDGGYAGSNNNRPVYYYGPNASDIGLTVSGGTGPTAELVRDFANLREAGLGFLCRHGLVYKLYSGTSGTATFLFDGTNGATGNTTWTAYCRRVSGSGTPALLLQSHGGSATFTSATYTRVKGQVSAVNTTSKMGVTVGANVVMYVVLPQLESTNYASSPIITRGATATRNATVVSKPWGGNKTNGISVSLGYTPANPTAAERMVLWSVYQDADNYLSVELTSTTMTARKRAHGVNYDSTLTVTPVADTTMTITAGFSTSGVTLTVDGVAGSSQTDGRALVLSETSTMQVGGLNSTLQCCGAIRELVVS